MESSENIKIAAFQARIGCGIPYNFLKEIIDYNPDFTILPEYFWIKTGAVDYASAAKSFKSSFEESTELSKKLSGYLISGTMIESEEDMLYNTCFIFKNGELIGKHRKVHLFGNECSVLTPGDGFYVYNLGGINCGILTCADNLHESSFLKMKELNARIIFAPTFSKILPEDTPEEKFKRDTDIFQKGAITSGTILIKCCSVGKLFDNIANGRSLICTPDSFIYRSEETSEKEVKVITAEINIM
ncbi:MAG: carbon-nitrogen hydrolase family protein [candidate division Zixibacteria bacterium]|nr:carbon-nitrogen hydrolase family protein [candidate division Zixibacteria bacterium]